MQLLGSAILIAAITLLLLARDRRLSAIALGAHYAGVGLLLADSFAFETVLVQIVLCLAAVLMWLPAAEKRPTGIHQPERADEKTNVPFQDVPLNLFFQVLTLVLCALAAIGLASTYPIATSATTSSLNFAFFWLMATGVVSLGTTRRPLNIGCGILFLLEAVQIAYLARAGTAQTAVLIGQVAIQLLLVLVIARFGSGAGREAGIEGVKGLSLAALGIVALLAVLILASDPFVSAILLTAMGLIAALAFEEGDEPERISSRARFVALVVIAGACLQIGAILAWEFQIAREQILARVAVGFLAIGLATLAGAFPFHWWLFELPRRASHQIGGVLVAAWGIGALALLLQLLDSYPWLLSDPRAQTTLMAIGALGSTFAALIAISQRDLEHLLMWTLAGSAGIVLAGIAANSHQGLVGVVVLVLNQALAVLLLLGCSSVAIRRGHPARMPASDDLASLTERAPLGSFGLALASLTLLGVPPFAGFLGRWLIFIEVSRQSAYLSVIIVGASLFSILSFVPIFRALLGGPGGRPAPIRREEGDVSGPEILPGRTPTEYEAGVSGGLGAHEGLSPQVAPVGRMSGRTPRLVRTALLLLALLPLAAGLYPVPMLGAVESVLKGLHLG